MISLSSPNMGALAPSASLTLTSGVKGAFSNTDGVVNAVSVFKSTTKIPSRKAEALYSVLRTLAAKLELKHSVVLATFTARQRAKHYNVLKLKSP